MLYGEFDDSWERAFPPARPLTIDFTGRPVIATINAIAGELMVLLGPMLWAALIDLWLYAQFVANWVGAD